MFYDRFEQLCVERKIKAAQVARDLHINPQTISMWKKQSSTPNAATVAKIADYFDVTVDYLLGLTHRPDIRMATQADIDMFTDGKQSNTATNLSDDEFELIERYKHLPVHDRIIIYKLVEFAYEALLEDKDNAKT